MPNVFKHTLKINPISNRNLVVPYLDKGIAIYTNITQIIINQFLKMVKQR